MSAVRPAPILAVGDWAYNDLNKHNARVVSVFWDPSLRHFQGGWRYNVPGLSTPDLRPALEGKPYVEYELVPGRSHCWQPITAVQS